MEENQQKRFDVSQRRLMQELKEEGLPYTGPVLKEGAIKMPPVQNEGQSITLRTGPIKSIYSRKSHLQQEQDQDAQEEKELPKERGDMFQNYQATIQARERQKEEWRLNLVQQMQD